MTFSLLKLSPTWPSARWALNCRPSKATMPAASWPRCCRACSPSAVCAAASVVAKDAEHAAFLVQVVVIEGIGAQYRDRIGVGNRPGRGVPVIRHWLLGSSGSSPCARRPYTRIRPASSGFAGSRRRGGWHELLRQQAGRLAHGDDHLALFARLPRRSPAPCPERCRDQRPQQIGALGRQRQGHAHWRHRAAAGWAAARNNDAERQGRNHQRAADQCRTASPASGRPAPSMLPCDPFRDEVADDRADDQRGDEDDHAGGDVGEQRIADLLVRERPRQRQAEQRQRRRRRSSRRSTAARAQSRAPGQTADSKMMAMTTQSTIGHLASPSSSDVWQSAYHAPRRRDTVSTPLKR